TAVRSSATCSMVRCGCRWRVSGRPSIARARPSMNHRGACTSFPPMRAWSFRPGSSPGSSVTMMRRSAWRLPIPGPERIPNDSPLQLRRRRARRLRRHGSRGPVPRPVEPGGAAPAPGASACVSTQRLRLLHRHALEGPPRAGRKRAAALLARCMAGVPRLYGEGARGARMDRGGDAGCGRPCAGQRPCGGRTALLPHRARRPDVRDRGGQRLEPALDCRPPGAGAISFVTPAHDLFRGYAGGLVKPIDLATLLVMGALWGGSYLFIRVGVPELGPLPLMGGRVALAALILWLGL